MEFPIIIQRLQIDQLVEQNLEQNWEQNPKRARITVSISGSASFNAPCYLIGNPEDHNYYCFYCFYCSQNRWI